MIDRCEVPRCRAEADLDYLGHGICERHWNELTAEDVPADKLRVVLGIRTETPTAMEATMTAKKKTARKAATKKAAKKAAAKRPKAAQDDLVVFAFRLTPAERDAIHKTAGPAKASRFIRRVAAAFAKEDDAAFRAVVKEARETRA